MTPCVSGKDACNCGRYPERYHVGCEMIGHINSLRMNGWRDYIVGLLVDYANTQYGYANLGLLFFRTNILI